MKEPKRYCEHCGAPMVEHKHSISKAIVRAFWKARRTADASFVFNIADCELTYPQRCNLQKLQYFGLIAKHGDNPKSGLWIILPAGVEFLAGERAVPKTVWTYRGVFVRAEEKMIRVGDVTGGWAYRDDYARSARPVGP